VDWVRTRAGRRRLFRGIRRLGSFDQRVFELYYWEHRRPVEIVEVLRMREATPVALSEVLAALSRIQQTMTDRHRGELLALVARSRPAVSFDDAELGLEPKAAADDPERSLSLRELDAHFASALAELPPEDAAIVRLTFVQGWSREQVRRGLHLERLSGERIAAILSKLRELLKARRLGPREAATEGLRFLEDEP
jgi:hypothetical protein